MLGDRWIYDRVPTERFPDYTRGNAGEVLADPVSPIGWTFCAEEGMVRGCVDGFEQMGVFDALEYDAEIPETFGLFGGYFYNSLTQSRLFGIRSGAGWEAIDNTFFDTESQQIPPYVAADWHDSPRHTQKLQATIGWCLSTPNVPEIDRQKGEVKALRDSRPDLTTLTAVQLVAPGRAPCSATCGRRSRRWCGAALGSSIGNGILPTLIGDDPTAMSKLITGIGDVDSTDIAERIFQLSRQVNASAELQAAFAAGLDGRVRARRRLRFRRGDGVQRRRRGVHVRARQPRAERVRPVLLELRVAPAAPRERDRQGFARAGDDADPAAHFTSGAAERARLIEKYSEQFKDAPEALGMFHAAVNSLAVFMAARERCKCNHIRVVGEVRECFLELGRRALADGHLAHERQVFMLLADEVDGWVADPAAFTARLAEREVDYLSLYELDPPYIVDGVVPPLRRVEAEGRDHGRAE